MAEIRIPLYLRVGSGEELHVGDVTTEPGTNEGAISLPGLIRKVAAEVERQIAERAAQSAAVPLFELAEVAPAAPETPGGAAPGDVRLAVAVDRWLSEWAAAAARTSGFLTSARPDLPPEFEGRVTETGWHSRDRLEKRVTLYVRLVDGSEITREMHA